MISDEELAKIVEIDELWPPEKKIDVSRAEALVELKQRRENALRPATKFLYATPNQQNTALRREITEVEIALQDYTAAPFDNCEKAKNHLLEELVDVQTACETMMAILGADETERNEVRRQVIEKNRRRGYYEGAAINK